MTCDRRNRLLVSASAAAILAIAMAPASAWGQVAPQGSAQQPPLPPAQPNPTEPAEETANGADIVVTGFRASTDDALNVKRTRDGFTDTVSSEGLDRFPDLNVGEALSRIPGIQLNREAGNRDATVNLRGLPGSFAVTTLNGFAFADPVLEGSTPLGAFISDIFSRFTVIKSPSAAEQAGGLSGIIDLRINPALGRTDGGSIKLSGEYNELGDSFAPAVTASYNKHITDDFAVFGVVAYRKERFRRDSININNYSLMSLFTTPNLAALFGDYYAAPGTAGVGETALVGGTGRLSKRGVLYPSSIRQSTTDNRGRLITGTAGAEYRLTPNLTAGVIGFYTDRDLDDNFTDIYSFAGTGTTTISAVEVTPDTSTLFTTPDGRNYIDKYTYRNAQASSSGRNESSLSRTYGLNAQLSFKNEDWRFASTGTYSKAKRIGNQIQIDATIDSASRATNPAGNGNFGSVFSGAGDVRDLAYTVLPLNTIRIPQTPLRPADTFGQPNRVRGAGTEFLQIVGTYSEGRNDVKAIQQDVERYIGGGLLDSIQAGLRYEDNKYISRGFRISALNVNLAGVTPALIVPSDYQDDFFGGKIPGALTDAWVTTAGQSAIDALLPDPNTLLPGQTLTPNGFVNNQSDNAYLLFNFTNRNKVTSAYALGRVGTELFGIPIRGNIGVRYEQTDNRIIALDRVASNRPNVLPQQMTKTFSNSYDNWLPSAMLRAELTDKLFFRVAGYKTYVRPQRREQSPITAVSTATTTQFTTLNVVIGNVELTPYKANSFDAGLEWYNRRGSVVAVNVFYKDIQDYITPINDTRISCPEDGLFNGTDYGVGNLSFNQTTRECRSSLVDPSGNPIRVNATGFINNAQPVEVTGVEVSVQQNLDFLSGFFRDFGVGINYSYTDIKGKTSGGADVVLNGVSPNNLNLIGYYETKKFGLRAVYNWRDVYDLASTGTFSGAARQARSRGQFDMSASYRFTDKLSIGVDAFNLTNSLREEFEQVDRVLRRSDYDGRTVVVTARAAF